MNPGYLITPAPIAGLTGAERLLIWKRNNGGGSSIIGKKMHKLGIVFPGQGSQYVGMGSTLHGQFEVVRETFRNACDVLDSDLTRLCFEGPQNELDLTVNTQTAVLTMDMAVWRVYEKVIGIRPAVLAGHSLGEYSALCVSGVFSFAHALKLVKARGKFAQEAVPVGVGAMAAIIGLPKDAVTDICRTVMERIGFVTPSVYNSADQTVVSGYTAAVEDVMMQAKEMGAKRSRILSLSVPFHCSLLNGVADRLRDEIKGIEFRDYNIPVIPNCDPDRMYGPEHFKDLLIRQISEPVQWQATIENMVKQGIDTVLEIGPGRTLTNLSKRIDGRLRIANIEDPDSLEKAKTLLFCDGQAYVS
jgi:[acyl-carrier-protein] S-malonyltransferase